MNKPKRGDFGILLRVRNAMAQRETTVRELADRSGIPYGTLQSYLLGNHNMPAPTLGKIATALDVSADWLILGKPAVIDAALFAQLLPLVETLLKTNGGKLTYEDVTKICLEEYSRRYAWGSAPADEEWETHMHDVGDHPRKPDNCDKGPQ